MKETRIVLRYADRITHPECAREYVSLGGYDALKKAVAMQPSEIIDEIKASGLRGRGGAGFPTGLKWSFVPKGDGPKYIVCNADEGEPATNKDRVIFHATPHSVLEGMAIAGKAVGSNQGYIYVRMEYPDCHELLEKAIASAYENGYLGKNILGSGFDFDIGLYSGAGSYVCGEETALIESIEGKRGEPRFKPPFPGVKGLWGKPTVVNNVETLANVPFIISEGAEAFRKFGTPKCPGTKIFSLNGNIRNPGVYEFPCGISLRTLFEEVGGGCPNGRQLLAVQTGGASTSLIRADQIDINMDIESAAAAGSSLGSGAMMFIDDRNDILDVVENLMEFFVHESCGKCTPCREGNMRLLEFVRKFKAGEGTKQDLLTMTDLSDTMMIASLCGLGQTSPMPVVSSIRNFADVYESAIERGRS